VRYFRFELIDGRSELIADDSEALAFRRACARHPGAVMSHGEPICSACRRTIPAADIREYRGECGDVNGAGFPDVCADCAELAALWAD